MINFDFKLSLYFFLLASLVLVFTYLLVKYLRFRKALPLKGELLNINLSHSNIHYQVSGHGSPLILLHGIGASIYTWRLLTPLLAKKFTVYNIDLPGFGFSSFNNEKKISVDSFAQSLLDFCQKLNIHNPRLIGSSMGGAIAIHFKLNFKDSINIDKVIAISPPLFSRPSFGLISKLNLLSPLFTPVISKKVFNRILKVIVHDQKVITDESIDSYMKPYLKNENSIHSFLKTFEFLFDKRIDENTLKIDQSIFLLWGKNDKIIPVKFLNLALKLNPKINFEIHPSAGHHLMEEDPEFIFKICQKFFM